MGDTIITMHTYLVVEQRFIMAAALLLTLQELINMVVESVVNNFTVEVSNFTKVADSFTEVADSFTKVADIFTKVVDSFTKVADSFTKAANNFIIIDIHFIKPIVHQDNYTEIKVTWHHFSYMDPCFIYIYNM